MSEEICPKCHFLIEHGSIYLDGEPIYPGSRRLDPRPKVRVCLNCRPMKAPDDQEDKPSPKGFYRDLYQWRNALRFQREEDYD